jgi:hypothetical protein
MNAWRHLPFFRRAFMAKKTYRPGRWDPDHLHPGLYLALSALALWFVFSAWAFGGGAYTDYLLTVASGLIFIAVAIPTALWRIWRNHPHQEESKQPFQRWASSELHIWQDRVSGRNAAVEILLPVAAVAFGMSLFAIIVHFTAH